MTSTTIHLHTPQRHKLTHRQHEYRCWSWPTSSGSLPPLMGLHGFTGSGLDMEGIAATLSLDTPFHAPDLVGHGALPPPQELEAYNMEACVALIEAWREVLVGGPMILLGYSMGGRSALHYALQYPQHTEALILIGATPGLSEADAQQTRQHADRDRAARIEKEGLQAFLDGWSQLPIIASQQAIPAPLYARMQRRKSQLHPIGLAQSLREMGTGNMPSAWHRLHELKMPLLLVTGEHDTKFHDIAVSMLQSLPNATHVVIRGVGHAAHLEGLANFCERCTHFLRTFTARHDTIRKEQNK